ncbi:hypothetical protein WQQ_13180 [Hydrocarboniphaga effusa AP103]|uniref:Uncharacterized protein n=1 Tax=Hydrocarboniphaga effusa AP103 TaxID=1172194 RepID=I8I4K9_9GAMM|nr:hypothetical protein WQQ_13180 [Hydrocarboniphaga effusa AP103]
MTALRRHEPLRATSGPAAAQTPKQAGNEGICTFRRVRRRPEWNSDQGSATRFGVLCVIPDTN